MTSGSRSARAAYSAAVYPAGPPPMMINSRVFTSDLQGSKRHRPVGCSAAPRFLRGSTDGVYRESLTPKPSSRATIRRTTGSGTQKEDRDMKKIAMLYLAVALLAFGTSQAFAHPDRKSTRLNSSHPS